MPTLSRRRLTLRVTLRGASPMVIRVVSVSDTIDLEGLHTVLQAVLGWPGRGSFLFRIQGLQLLAAHQRSRRRRLCDFGLQHREVFVYICPGLSDRGWDVRVVRIQDDSDGDGRAVCVAGRGMPPLRDPITGATELERGRGSRGGVFSRRAANRCLAAIAAKEADDESSSGGRVYRG